MNAEEVIVLDVLREHDDWTAQLAAGSMMHNAFAPGLDVDHLAAASGLHRRTARRAVDRLAASGLAIRDGHSYRVSHAAGTVNVEQSGA